jgi:hypothetical protein
MTLCPLVPALRRGSEVFRNLDIPLEKRTIQETAPCRSYSQSFACLGLLR